MGATLVFACTVCNPVETVSSTTGPETTVDDESTAPMPIPTTSTSTATSTGSTSDDSSDATTSTSSSGTTPDQPDFGAGDGCKKIDVLYVLDRGTFKAELIPSMRAGIQYFNQRLLETFGHLDLHLMVVTDIISAWYWDSCEDECQDYGHCNSIGIPDFPCESAANIGWCDQRIGSGLILPIATDAANHLCPVGEGRRFVATSSDPNPAEALDCITHTGIINSVSSAMAQVMESAFRKENRETCHPNFLRDDALLMIVWAGASAGGEGHPGEWAQTLHEAKGWDKDAVGVIGVLWDTTLENPICLPPGNPDNPSPPVRFVRDYIPHHVIGSICAEDQSPYYDQGIEMMLELCEGYIPR